MPSSKGNHELTKVASSLEATSSLVHTLLNEIYDTVSEFARFKAELESLQNTVEKLTAVVQDGKGGPSLITSLAVFKEQLEGLRKGEKTILRELKELEDSYQKLSLKIAKLEPQKAKDHNIKNLMEITEKRKYVKELVVGLVIAVVTFLVGYYFEKQPHDPPKEVPTLSP